MLGFINEYIFKYVLIIFFKPVKKKGTVLLNRALN